MGIDQLIWNPIWEKVTGVDYSKGVLLSSFRGIVDCRIIDHIILEVEEPIGNGWTSWLQNTMLQRRLFEDIDK